MEGCRLALLSALALLAAVLISGRRVRNAESNKIPNAVEEFTNDRSQFPSFAREIPNVTVTVGKEALLACVVDNLNNYKVAWVRVDTQTILSIHHQVITQNPRISLTYNDQRTWYLHIKDVHETDRGWYMCQINTDPMHSCKGYLQVVVPPTIIDKDTSTDMVVRESSNVTLTCKARGYPEPYVMWRREDGNDITYNGEPVTVVDGETLHITKVSRLHMGAYLCIASNSVPPSISKRVFLIVQFPPMMTISNQLEAAYVGQDVSLACQTEAYPHSINYWTTQRGDMIVSGSKYEATATENGFVKHMTLKIKKVSKNDFGNYMCVAKNSLGETDGVIRLDEVPAPTTTPASTVLPRKKNLGRVKPLKERAGTGDNSVLAADSYVDDTTLDESLDEDYTLAPQGDVRPPVARGSGAPSQIGDVGFLVAAGLLLVRLQR